MRIIEKHPILVALAILCAAIVALYAIHRLTSPKPGVTSERFLDTSSDHKPRPDMSIPVYRGRPLDLPERDV